MKKLFGFFVFFLFFTSCKTIKVTPPPRLVYDTPIRTPNYSTVKINASISQNDVINSIRSQIKNPIVNENPIKVIATIAATESITEKELIKKLITPYKPGYWLEVSKKVSKTVTESYSCLLKPWKWGKCWKNVLKSVWETTLVWVEPQAAVFQWVAVEVIKTYQKLYKTEVRIHYPTDLVDVKLSFNGNTFEFNTKFRTNLKFDYDQAIIPLGPTLSLNSVIKSPVDSYVKAKGNITIVEPGKIKIDIDKSATTFRFGEFSPNLPVLEGQDLDNLLFPVLANLIKPQIEKMAEDAINDAFVEAIDDNDDKLNFRSEIDDFTRSIGQPKEIADNVWININPRKVLSGQITGANNRIFYTAGLEFIPQINLTPIEPSISPNDIPFETRINIKNESYLDLQFNFELKTIGNLIKTDLNNYISEQPSIKKIIKVSDVEIFRTDNDNLSIKIIMKKKRLFGSWTFFANAYITTKMNYNSLRGHFSLDNIGFTLETKESLVSSILNSIVDDKVIELLEENSTFSIKDELRIANSAIRDTTMVLDQGILSLKFKEIEISSPYITSKNLEVNAKFKGKLNFSYIPDDQKPIYSKSTTSARLFLDSDEQSEDIILQMSKNIISKDLNTTSTSIDSVNYQSYERLNFKKASDDMDYTTSDYVINLKIGDTIFEEKDGKIRKKIIKFEDLPQSNEILISEKPGEIERQRMNQSEYFLKFLNKDLDYEHEVKKVVQKDTINISDAMKYIDQNVIIEGTLVCLNEFTAPSGEQIKKLQVDDCENDDVNIFVYLASVSDNIPDETYINKKVFIDAIISFESGKPTIKIKNNNRIKLQN
ncbi:DUF4403 family protein [Tamlana haliotis]|uniref:DUF4403 family protein n=1 Tax=Pseudotamlana haliotis TaxID=2614804 RepID=A0A6N6MBJ1_9FLAO|nr:DUF4403 family protein [Tamlana haliotis]KAB1067948.1 DUF4403 family protein [Tamlana haliotis]